MEDAALARPEYRADLRKVASGTNSKRESVPGERGFCDLLSICWVLLSWPCVAWKTAALFKSDGVADSQCSPYKPPVTFVCCLSLCHIYTPTMHASYSVGFLACHLTTFFLPTSPLCLRCTNISLLFLSLSLSLQVVISMLSWEGRIKLDSAPNPSFREYGKPRDWDGF